MLDSCLADAAVDGDPLNVALAGIVADALGDWDEVQGSLPDVLYHYTNVAGLIGICSSASMHATNLRFANDATELAHAWRLMVAVLTEAREQATSSAQLELIDEIDRATANQWAGYPDFYAVSLSANGDLLSQWRGYGDLGGGYAIGLAAELLAPPPTSHPQPRRFLNRVVYSEATQLRLLRDTAQRMLNLFATVTPGSDHTAARAHLFSALGELVGFAFGFKAPAWEEEQEWRAVFALPDGMTEGVQFRSGGGVAVPYLGLHMGNEPGGKLPIREVVIGPTVDPETAQQSLEILLAANGYEAAGIRLSTVPLRR